MTRAPTATPTPIPAFAAVMSPPLFFLSTEPSVDVVVAVAESGHVRTGAADGGTKSDRSEDAPSTCVDVSPRRYSSFAFVDSQ